MSVQDRHYIPPILKEGVSETDWIAFPYGKAVKEGAPVKELEGSGFADQLY